jgi:CSLREA domain-containing protein
MRRNRSLVVRSIPYLALLLIGVTAACGGGAVPCDAPEILVTKTADTNDGVCSGADCSLREAVVRANACAGTQTIRVPAGTYTLTRTGIDENAAATGDLDLTGSVTILGDGQPVIDGNAADRIFDVKPGITVSLSGLVIQNGLAMYGAGIWSHDSTLNVNESTIQNNHTTWEGLHGMFPDGGGILTEGEGVLGVYQSDITGNSAARGGGIAVISVAADSQTVTLSYTNVSGNDAEMVGGGVYLDEGAEAEFIRFEADDNSSGGEGGGIYNAGDLEIMNATLEGNTSGEHGGGIFNLDSASFIARTAMLSGNTALEGGGIDNYGMAHFYQSSIVYNTASAGEGGGAYNEPGALLRIDNTTVGANGAAGGDGIYNDGGIQLMFATIAGNDGEGVYSTGGEATMRNTILSANPGGNCAGTAPDSLGFNIDSGAACGLIEPGDLSNTDPMLDAPAPAGTWSPAYELLAGSPAIDTADPDRCSGTDQWGVIRPQGANCDRGAVERMTAGGDGSIGGIVWHDLCSYLGEMADDPHPSAGCIELPGGGYEANGILEPGEPGLAGVTLHLKSGSCAAATDLMVGATAADGAYSFTGLAAGTYCVTVGALTDGNDAVLIPGGWTYPVRDDVPQQTEVVLGAGDARTDVNFGWDFQFLPAPEVPESTPTPTPAPLSFVNPWVSTKELFFAGPNALPDCGPRQAKFQIGLSSLEGVANVNLFVRLKEQSSGKLGAWTSGIPMNPIGNNLYLTTVLAEDIPEARTFGPSWVQYQFVALDAGGNAVGRSEVYGNMTFAQCGYRPKSQG